MSSSGKSGGKRKAPVAKNAKVVATKKRRKPKGMPDFSPGETLVDLVKKKWRLGELIGWGGFGALYYASPNLDKSVGDSATYVAKVEPHSNGPLFGELAFYQRVAKEEMLSKWMTSKKLKYLGVPAYTGSGSHEKAGKKYRFMIMERYGSDVDQLFTEHSKCFHIETVLILAIRIINILEYIHKQGYVHADIKGSNLMMGYTSARKDQVFLVDYGLAYRFNPDGVHKEYKEDPKRRHDGTVEFTSRDAHKGVGDEVENEKRRTQCLDEMSELEKQFADIKEQLYKERISQIEKKLETVQANTAEEYITPLFKLEEMCKIRLEVADILKDCKLQNANNKFVAEGQATKQYFESEKSALVEIMRVDLEEKIRKLEEDRHNSDISADLWLESQSVKKHKKSSDGFLTEKKKKPVTVSGPYIVYMLRDMDIYEDWAAIRRAKGALSRRKSESHSGSQGANSLGGECKTPYNAKYEDGKLFYEGECFLKGSHVIVESKGGAPVDAMITGINTGEVWIKKPHGDRFKLYIGQLQKGKFKLRKA